MKAWDEMRSAVNDSDPKTISGRNGVKGKQEPK